MLTRDNYFSHENQIKYFGSSQFKDFLKCPSMAMATVNGEYSLSSDVLIQGSYMDAYFEGNLQQFQAEHPEVFNTKTGNLLAKYAKLAIPIFAIESDPIMRNLCYGEQQKIYTGEIDGVLFKIMIDSLLPDRIVDRKCMKDFKDVWKNGAYVPWWKAYGYEIQACIYREIYRQNAKDIPFELVAISKETIPDKDWVRFSDKTHEETLDYIKSQLPTINAIKTGLLPADKCGMCGWCKQNKKLIKYVEV